MTFLFQIQHRNTLAKCIGYVEQIMLELSLLDFSINSSLTEVYKLKSAACFQVYPGYFMCGFQQAAHALQVQERFFKKGFLICQHVSFVLAVWPTLLCCCQGEVCILQLESQMVT